MSDTSKMAEADWLREKQMDDALFKRQGEIIKELREKLATAEASERQMREQVNAKYWEQIKADNSNLNDLLREKDSEIIGLRADKDNAYEERNRVVALLARLFPSGLATTAIEGWSADWHNCVYIDLPFGQVSWHIHDSQMRLFDGLQAYSGKWDGHTTDEKYGRIDRLAKAYDRDLVRKR
jgi:hypothetical protein